MAREEFLTGVRYPTPFDELAVELCRSASRYVCILSPCLDHAAFDNTALVDALGELARTSRQTRVRLLVSDTREIITRGHRLLQLSRRLPSTILLQKLIEHPDWNGETIVIRDHTGVLFKPGGSDHEGFYEPASGASTRRHLERFDELWRCSERDAELRALHI